MYIEECDVNCCVAYLDLSVRRLRIEVVGDGGHGAHKGEEGDGEG